MPVKMFPKYTARHCSKPPVHWSLMSKADPRCCAKAAVDAPRVPTPGAPGGKGCSSTLLSLIASRWHIIKNPAINPKCYGFLNLVFDKARKRHKGSSKKGARPKSTASSSYSYYIISFSLRASLFSGTHTKWLQAPCPTQHWPSAPHTQQEKDSDNRWNATLIQSLVPKALGAAKPL